MKPEEFASFVEAVRLAGLSSLPRGAERDAGILRLLTLCDARRSSTPGLWTFSVRVFGGGVIPITDWTGAPSMEGLGWLTSREVNFSREGWNLLLRLRSNPTPAAFAGAFSTRNADKARGFAGINRPDRTVKVPSGSADENPCQGSAEPAPRRLTEEVMVDRARRLHIAELSAEVERLGAASDSAFARAAAATERALGTARTDPERRAARRDGHKAAVECARSSSKLIMVASKVRDLASQEVTN